jgi:hypothetical protein
MDYDATLEHMSKIVRAPRELGVRGQALMIISVIAFFLALLSPTIATKWNLSVYNQVQMPLFIASLVLYLLYLGFTFQAIHQSKRILHDYTAALVTQANETENDVWTIETPQLIWYFLPLKRFLGRVHLSRQRKAIEIPILDEPLPCTRAATILNSKFQMVRRRLSSMLSVFSHRNSITNNT